MAAVIALAAGQPASNRLVHESSTANARLPAAALYAMPCAMVSCSGSSPSNFPAVSTLPKAPTIPTALKPARENPPRAAIPMRIAHSTPAT